MTTDQQIKEEVRKRYGKAATRAREKSADSGCCGGERCLANQGDCVFVFFSSFFF